ncbi:ATP-binding protein [Trinickia sp.]|uniref:ATP-binding protein n=1 Tax=Trinickia sp. TaxID=2571163 RepID=UPI003F808628
MTADRWSRVARMAGLLAACVFAAAGIGACGQQEKHGDPTLVGWDLRLPLSPSDRAYLESLPPLRVGVDPKWAPMAFVDAQGKLDGISADYLDFLRDTLHIRFRLVPTRSWAETVRFANDGRIDLVVAASKFDGLDPGFTFSSPYVRYPLVIVTRETAPFIGGIEDLDGARVAIVGDVQTARGRFGGLANIHALTVGSAEDGLKAVAQGRAFAYIGNLGVVDRIVRERYAGELRVAAPADRTQDLSFGIAPAYARLAPLVDRVLQGIPEVEREHIQNSWLSTQFAFGVAPRTLWLVLAPVGALTLVFVALLSWNTLRLRKEVRQRRRTERDLVFETRFKTLLMNTVPIPVFVKDSQGRYLAVNPAYERAVGARAEDIVGVASPPSGPARRIDDSVLASVARDVIDTGRSAQGEFFYRGPDDAVHEAVYWVRPCSGEGDAREAALCAFVDVSDLRRMERREREQERRLVQLTQSLPSVVFQLKLAGAGRPRFELVFANRRADELLQPSGPVSTDTFTAFARALDASHRRRLTKMFLRSARGLASVRDEFMVERQPGRQAWFHVEAAPQACEDGSVEWNGYLHDVTEAKEAHAALIAAKHEAEAAARARDSFIATVSHEIRTPMSGIVGILQLLNHEGLSADDRYLVEMAGNAAELSFGILNDILDFAKSESGELSLESASMCIADIVKRSAGLLAPDIERKGLRLHVDVSPAVAPRHIGDAQRLGQVVLNLLSNAVKFTDQGGVSIRVDVAAETVGHQTLSMHITDTGIGISRDDQARLFAPFSQARGTLASRYGGTGLGLAICKRLIEQMGGTIALESEPGHGTTIAIALRLPVARGSCASGADTQAAPEAAGRAPDASAGTSRRILLVEDQFINREVLRRQLASLNVPCDSAEDGAQALTAYTRGDYEMIITDCAMPLLDGVALIESIRRRERGAGRHCVLIALTADATAARREACIEAGADEVCVKPLSLEQLRALLERYRLLAAPGARLEPLSAGDELRRKLKLTLLADLDRLRACASDTNREQLRDIAHAIAGTAAWFQLRDVAEAATRLQVDIEAPSWPRASVLALAAAMERTIAGAEI